jgi:exocyst complex component 7
LDNVISYYSVSQEVETVIRDGMGSANDGDYRLEPFLAAMTRLQSAREYFEKNNPQSVELENVVCFLSYALIES